MVKMMMVVGSKSLPFGELQDPELEEVLYKANLYSTLGAQAQGHHRVSMWGALGHGMWAFIRL